LKGTAEVLLVSYSDLKHTMETKIGYKCDDSYMEDNGMEKINARIRDVQDGKKKMYQYIMVDIDDVTIIIERFGRTIKRALNDAKIPIDSVQMYAFSSTDSEKIQLHCTKGGFRFYVKPNRAG